MLSASVIFVVTLEFIPVESKTEADGQRWYGCWQETVLTGWFYLLSPELGEAKHLQVDADAEKENAPGLHQLCFCSARLPLCGEIKICKVPDGVTRASSDPLKPINLPTLLLPPSPNSCVPVELILPDIIPLVGL